MTLVEILVKELLGKGGWPAGVNKMWQDYDRELRSSGNNIGIFTERLADAHRERGIDIDQLTHGHFVYRKQYEAALAESKKVVWSGEGLPPVGCECQYSLNGGKTWLDCKIEFIVGTQGIVMSCDVFEGVQYVSNYTYRNLAFRPIRSEEERKRDEITGAIESCIMLAYADNSDKTTEAHLYDAIAAGKIPHVKIV